MRLLFGSLSLKTSKVKHDWHRVIVRWATFWEVSLKACECGQNKLKSLVLDCEDSH